MVIVHGTFPVKSDMRDEALDVMRRMSQASRAEPGCVSYEFYVGLSDPNKLMLFQEWETVDALQDHFQTAHMEDFLKILPSLLDGEVSTRRYEVRTSDGYGHDDLTEFEPEFEPEFAPRQTYREKIVH